MGAPVGQTMERDKEAARELAQKFIGSWHGTGSVGDGCSLEGWWNIHPPNGQGKSELSGYIRVKLCGVYPISRTTLRGERDADGMAFSHYSRNANKLEGEPGGAPTRFTGMLTSIDADALKATYTIQGDARGSYVMDGRNMTEKVDRTSRAGQFKSAWPRSNLQTRGFSTPLRVRAS